ncbi:TraB/GumN family protein [Burkholderia mayonis]|uniref:Polysaccharide biosynthesis protein GumN n=1 Tax=Burkholderia mayonis TaxID=1385591 RepID=A0A1B4G6L2_9BURK|nr:TraB/GumN family protein [Burkholderia mayonis]AOJ11563.1 polysaccharide biosynthesis protein GumN [Burkholderia mayonis]KVE46536.1 polysaccharide biosynthesis protein GumN [Burkholderia mayonis]
MPEAVAAREAARRSCNGGRRAATHAGRHPRRWRARALASAVLAGACATGGIAWPPVGALAAGSAATAPLSQSPIPSPSLSLPGFHAPPSTSNGTVASGAVRTQPARMPFYVATKGKVTIYVLGTLHVGDPADYPQNQPFRRPILAALAASPTLALELSPDDLLESQDDVSKYGVCNYACLPRLLPPPLWQKLAGRLRGNPAALAGIRNMRPWLASLVVETYDSLSAGLQTEYGTEAQLQNVFLRKKGGKVVGLETLAEQMRAFTGLTLAQQREMLAQDMVQTPAQNAADVRALHRLWRIGDADALAAWATAKTERLARVKAVADSIDNKIVYERNRRFVARVTAIAAPNRPLFVAIGALHLGGPKGVLELLRQQGYRVDAG